MKIAVYQGPVAFEDSAANLEATEKALQEAEARDAAILAMPETFLHGYFRDARLARKNAVTLDGAAFRRILDRLQRYRPTLLLGLNEIRNGQLFNTVAVIRRGKLIGRYSKNFLVFNYFERGHEFPVFEQDGIPFGVVICADTSYVEPSRILAMKGAQIIFTPHFNYIGYNGVDDHTRRVRQHHIAIAIDNDVYVARANVVVPESQGADRFGYRGVGVGDSFILDRRGRVLTEAGLLKPAVLVADLPDDDLRQPRRRPWQRVSAPIYHALVEQYQAMFGTHNDAPPSTR